MSLYAQLLQYPQNVEHNIQNCYNSPLWYANNLLSLTPGWYLWPQICIVGYYGPHYLNTFVVMRDLLDWTNL